MHDFLHHVVLPVLDYLNPAPSPSPSVTDHFSTSSSPNIVLTPIPSPSVTTPPQPKPPDNTVKVAVVTAFGLVLATAITAIASTFKRDPAATRRPSPTEAMTRRYVTDLEKDRRELVRVREVYTHLREACYQRGLNPDDLIEEQEHHP